MELRDNEQIEDLQRGGYRIIQNREKFRFGQDAVLLSWFAEVRPSEKVLDLCSGSGIVPILMHARYGCGEYTGLELQADMAEIAARSAELNAISDRVRFLAGDLKQVTEYFPRGSFQVVTVNPPYMKAGTGLSNPDPDLALAKHEIACTLSDVVGAAEAMLRDRGRFYMVHRVSRSIDVLEELRAHRLTPSRIRFVHPYRDADAKLMLVAATKGGKDIVKVEPPLVVFDAPGAYTKQISGIYWEAPAEP